MQTKIILLTLVFLLGCGKEVSIPNDLERHSSITSADSKEAMLEGTLSKTDDSRVKIGEKIYKVSRFSSHSALEYVLSLPEGDTPVKFRGEVKTDEVLISKFY